MEVEDDEEMVNSVEGLGEVNEGHDNTMRDILVNVRVDEVKETD